MYRSIISIAFAVSAGACGPAYLTAAAQPTYSASGPLAPVIASGGGGHSTSVGVGLGGHGLGFEATIHAVDVGAGTFAIPEIPTGGPVAVSAAETRYATMHSTLEARWTVLRLGRLGLQLRGGGSHGVVVDKMTLSRDWGIGYTAGVGVELRATKQITLWADAAQTMFRYVDGPAKGDSTLRGITVGIALGR